MNESLTDNGLLFEIATSGRPKRAPKQNHRDDARVARGSRAPSSRDL